MSYIFSTWTSAASGSYLTISIIGQRAAAQKKLVSYLLRLVVGKGSPSVLRYLLQYIRHSGAKPACQSVSGCGSHASMKAPKGDLLV